MSSLVLIDEPGSHVRRLRLHRPEQLNAMTSELCEALHQELRSIAADRSCRVVILTGAGRGFCAGLDLRGYGAAPGNDGSDEARDRLGNQQHMSSLILALRALPQPVIAAVNGPAAGFGLALCLGCDIRYASRDAAFRAAFINIGVSNCDMGTSWLLPRLIGASRSHELIASLEVPSEQTAVEYEDRQQIVASFGQALPEAISAFLEKRPAEFAD
jgi:enoyl-CoA hydratase